MHSLEARNLHETGCEIDKHGKYEGASPRIRSELERIIREMFRLIVLETLDADWTEALSTELAQSSQAPRFAVR